MKYILMGIFLLVSTNSLHANDRYKTSPTDTEHVRVQEDGKTVLYKKHHEVNFDDTLIEGEVKNPNEFYFVHRPEQKFGKLVKRREQFHKEMLRDTMMMR